MSIGYKSYRMQHEEQCKQSNSVCFFAFLQWSFGVTLWELITLGQQPYNSIDAFEMVFYLKNGHRLGQPTGCPDDLFTIMGYCWALSGEERPGFAQLLILLTKFFNALIQFI